MAGRTNLTRRVLVDLEMDGRQISEVPFLVVRTGEGRWLVEEVPLERIMGRQ